MATNIRIKLAICSVVVFGVSVTGVLATEGEVTTIRVIESPGTGFTLDSDATGDLLRTWLVLSDGDVLMFERNTTTTLPSSVTIRSTANEDTATITAGQAGEIGQKTCCTFTCSDLYHFVIQTKNCEFAAGGCTKCWNTCSDGWGTCPVEATEIDKI